MTPETREWSVADLDCPVCAKGLEQACGAVPGVIEAAATPTNGRLRLVVDPAAFRPDRLAAAARGAGHPLVVDPTAGTGGSRQWLLALAGVALVAGLVGEARTGEQGWPYLITVAAGLVGLLPRAWSSLCRRRADMHLLITIALLGAVALGDWREAAVLAVLFALALWIEQRSMARTGGAIGHLLELAPPTARVDRDGATREVPVGEVAVGELVRVRPGDAIPLDGEVVEGASAVDQRSVTGESVPAAKGPGQPVYAGTLAVEGALVIRVTAVAGESTLSRVVALVQEAQRRPSPTARTVDRFAAWYTPTILILAGLAALTAPLFGLPWSEGVYRALVLLVIGCPCAIVIATPVAIASGLTRAARDGVLVRGGQPLEALAEVDTVALDKTGTLTRGEPTLQQVVSLRDGVTADQALALAAAAEADSAHPLARAVVAAAAARGLQPPVAEAHRAEPGRGVVATVAGRPVWLGNHQLLDLAGIELDPAGQTAVAVMEQAGMTVMLLAGAAGPMAAIGLADTLRDSASAAVAELRELGCDRILLLTGDAVPVAEAVGAAAGIAEVHAQLLPADKQRLVDSLAEAGHRVVMVGDGINDAPALAAAPVGVAVGAAGSAIAMETADAAILGDDLRALPAVIALARRVRRTIVANIALAFGIRLVLVPLALAGSASLALAILGDMGGSLLVTANSLRLLRHR